MDLKKIEKLIDELRVVSFEEHDVECESSFIKIKEGLYHLNNGKTIKRERVTHRSGNMNAVVIFGVTKDKKVLLVVQPRVFLPTETRVIVEMPAGYIDANEDAIEAGKRELAEETGYVGSSYHYIDSYYPSLGYSGEKISIVLALDCEKKYDQNLDVDEYINYFECDISDIKYLIDNNYIIDATSKLTYYEVMDYLNNNGGINEREKE